MAHLPECQEAAAAAQRPGVRVIRVLPRGPEVSDAAAGPTLRINRAVAKDTPRMNTSVATASSQSIVRRAGPLTPLTSTPRKNWRMAAPLLL
jgi:hypothetical protein